MSAPLHRSVDMLSGQVARPSRVFEALGEADARIAELAELRALREKTPESKVLAHKLAALVDSYLHYAADCDQRTMLINLANMLRYSTALCAAQGSEIHHYESEALDEWLRADGLQTKLDAAEQDLVDARAEVRRLTGELTAVRSQRDTAQATGGAM